MPVEYVLAMQESKAGKDLMHNTFGALLRQPLGLRNEDVFQKILADTMLVDNDSLFFADKEIFYLGKGVGEQAKD